MNADPTVGQTQVCADIVISTASLYPSDHFNICLDGAAEASINVHRKKVFSFACPGDTLPSGERGRIAARTRIFGIIECLKTSIVQQGFSRTDHLTACPVICDMTQDILIVRLQVRHTPCSIHRRPTTTTMSIFTGPGSDVLRGQTCKLAGGCSRWVQVFVRHKEVTAPCECVMALKKRHVTACTFSTARSTCAANFQTETIEQRSSPTLLIG